MQADLFASPLVPGLSLAQDIVTCEEEAALVAAFDGVDLPAFRFQGWTARRRTATFGWRYDFDASTFSPTLPIPDFLMPLRARAASFAGVAAHTFVQALIIRYEPGAGIGWHKDRPEFDDVVGVSLGAPAAMRFRRRTAERIERASAPLEPRSIYHLAGEVRSAWEHSIAPMAQLRWSVTFRNLSVRGRERGG